MSDKEKRPLEGIRVVEVWIGQGIGLPAHGYWLVRRSGPSECFAAPVTRIPSE